MKAKVKLEKLALKSFVTVVKKDKVVSGCVTSSGKMFNPTEENSF